MDIVESFQCYFSLLEDRKQELMRDLDSAYNNKRMLINGHISKNQENHERFVQVGHPLIMFSKILNKGGALWTKSRLVSYK